MAFNPVNLTFEYSNSINAYGWVYTTSDNIATVETSGYFSNNTDAIRTGDTIKVVASDDSRLYSAASPAQWRKLATGITSVNNLVNV